MTKKQQTFIILILGALSTISPFAIDMYLPAFPAIASDLGTSIANIQLSLTSYFVGIAAGQLLYGPLLDRYGRKMPLYIGLAVYLITSFGCAFTSTADALIGMRFLQALGGCAGMVAAQTLVRDLFPLERTAQAFSSITLVVAVSPMIAPTVGGYMTSAFGWHSVFITLAVVTLFILVSVYFFLPKGKAPDLSISLKPKAVLGNFFAVVRQPQFITYSLAGGFATSAPFAYIAGSAHVFINVYHTTKEEYGWIFALIGAIIIGSTQLNHLFLKRFKSEQIVNAALLYQMVVGVIMIFAALNGVLDKTGLVILIAMFLAGHGLSNPNTTALSLAPFTRHTGSAASLLGCFRMGIGGIVSALVSVFHDETEMPMLVMMMFCVVSGYLILQGGKGIIQYQANRSDVKEDSAIAL
jgi:DHA1 family bicyclomycin/chloramphenicol resistance-like MFS transporter